ncbi:hypothetical protein AAVH_19642 [Aphelenchoides avenae]|nr:hypothetical protein AAVH_19642 [Aphelenchus avenae]
MEYELVVFGSQVNVDDARDEALTNAFGDVLEVETLVRDRELCVTCLSKVNAERTTILCSTDGPKVWDFGTIHDLESHLISSGVTELLVRSGLIANEKACKCGEPMNLRLRTPMRCDVSNAPSNTETDNYVVSRAIASIVARPQDEAWMEKRSTNKCQKHI